MTLEGGSSAFPTLSLRLDLLLNITPSQSQAPKSTELTGKKKPFRASTTNNLPCGNTSTLENRHLLPNKQNSPPSRIPPHLIVLCVNWSIVPQLNWLFHNDPIIKKHLNVVLWVYHRYIFWSSLLSY